MIYLYMCFTIFLSACNISTDKTYLYVEVDTLPVLEYENGLNDYIYSNLKWPNQFGGEGEVIASFIVTQGGKTNKIQMSGLKI